jgi:nucleoside-diphosphate-sugar epimerase
VDTILITGAGGLAGAHLIDALKGKSKIIAASREGSLRARNDVTPLALDLSRSINPQVLPRQLDAVAYLAQSNRFREFPAGAQDMTSVNVTQMLTLLDHAVNVGARTFVYASTGGVYGTGPTPFREDSAPASPLGFYPASKLAGEVLARAYESKIAIVILRFFFIYGRGQKAGMLVPRLIDSVREGREIQLQGTDGITINPIHAWDAATAVKTALTLTNSATINVGGPEPLTLRQMAKTISNALGLSPNLTTQPNVAPGDLVGDIAQQIALLGEPRIRFADGIKDIL